MAAAAATAGGAWDGPSAEEMKAAGAEALPEGRSGVRIAGWIIESRNRPILKSSQMQLWEELLGTTHLPEMVFGESSLTLTHVETGTKLHFNALDALRGWKQEALPPVEVPAAAKWKFRSKPSDQVILDYDYTFTTPYSGSEGIIQDPENLDSAMLETANCNLLWEDTDERIDLAALSSKEPILFFDEVILYEDELADNGVSLLTVKVRVMPSSWFLLLRYWLRVDGVLMRLRDTRVHCPFRSNNGTRPVVLRECCWREATIASLTAKGSPPDSALYGDPAAVVEKLAIVSQKTQRLKFHC